jgi:hypothetical protein
MRLRVSLGIILLGASACAHLPELVRIDVDGSSVELKRKPEPPAPDPQQPDAPER